MARTRQPLPEVPLYILSRQQGVVYTLSTKYTTGEIAQILSIPEKQVRQVYSAIRSKGKEFANKNTSPAPGAEPVHNAPEDRSDPRYYDFIRELVENNGLADLSAKHFFARENYKDVLVKGIPGLTGKNADPAGIIPRRAGGKPFCSSCYDDNFITKIDTGNTRVKVKFSLVRSAMHRLNLGSDQLSLETGISPRRLEEIESLGAATYEELFLLIRRLEINPYGPSEKDRLVKKLSDPNWIRAIRYGSAGSGTGENLGRRERLRRDKSRYRNRVMYYGMSQLRRESCSRDRPVVEDGRNGLFPLALTRDQQSECGWYLKKFLIRPVYTYRHPRLRLEADQLERRLAAEKDPSRAEKYRREMINLKEDIIPEDGRSIFIVNRSQFSAINKILFDPK